MQSRVIVIFGAGSGLGRSVARRFGREGYRVAVVGRRLKRLEPLVAELATEGIESAPFVADLASTASIPSLVEAIRSRMGRIDIVEYSPVNASLDFIAAADLDADKIQNFLNLMLLAPLEITKAVLPEMKDRAEGAILVTHGFTAVRPVPHMSGLGPAKAAARNWIYSLNAELEGSGVFAGTLTVGAIITGSESAKAAAEMAGDRFAGYPTVDPDDLAEIYWDMVANGGPIEVQRPD